MGEFLTRASIWVAMAAWTFAIARAGRPGERTAWAAGLGAYLVHVVLSFACFYEWSLGVAWEETARDTRETVGFDSGVGLLVNFAFLAILAVDLACQWRTGKRKGAAWIDGLVAFLILNGAVIFGEGPVRILGLVLLAVLAVAWFRRAVRARGNYRGDASPRR